MFQILHFYNQNISWGVEFDPEGVFLKNLASEIATYQPKQPKQQI